METTQENKKTGRMKATFISIVKTIKSVSEYYFTIITVLGVLWGGFIMYNNWKESNKTLQSNVKTIMQTQIRQGRADSLLLKNQFDMEVKINGLVQTTNSLQSSYVQYISNDKTLTKQDFLKYMEGLSFDLKKNSMTSEQIRPTSSLIPSPK